MAKKMMTDETAREAYERVKNGESVPSVARSYGVAVNAINSILLGKTYRHLELEQLDTSLHRLRVRVGPVGTQNGKWITIGEPYFAEIYGRRRAKVRVRCEDCDTESEITISDFKRAARCIKRTGESHHNWKGAKYPRTPSFYKAVYIEKQNGLCAFPLCGKPLPENSRLTVVDHDHRCCGNGRTRGDCIRGAVHMQCNINWIKAFDLVRTVPGVIIPQCVRDYLDGWMII